jgi:hypothetical protein
MITLTGSGRHLLSRFGRVPARLTINSSYLGYTLSVITRRINFRR